jgi:hypothetical protein
MQSTLFRFLMKGETMKFTTFSLHSDSTPEQLGSYCTSYKDYTSCVSCFIFRLRNSSTSIQSSRYDLLKIQKQTLAFFNTPRDNMKPKHYCRVHFSAAQRFFNSTLRSVEICYPYSSLLSNGCQGPLLQA